ncbi:hypothetical protein [Olivibacter sp. XZL3]|uniref:hypothetical protein n=1 Tax=Olivibacter sp. XZL3 TaxID=1735116 RepID=UPI0010670C24|nr:hypothetical protein [Olivibacter sp. XZL3]
MRILIYLVLTTVWIFGAQAQQKPNVGIYVKFENVDNEMFVQDMTDLERLTDESDYPRLEQDTSGYFTAFFHIEKPKYVRILRNILYIKPHDTLKIHIAQSPEDSKFEIDNKGINAYLSKTPFPKGGSFIDQESLMKGQDLVHAIAEIRKEGESRKKDLNNLSTDDTVFLKQERRRITFDVLNSYFALPIYFTYLNHIKDADSVKQIVIFP